MSHPLLRLLPKHPPPTHPPTHRAYHAKFLKIPSLNIARVSISPTHKPSHSAELILRDPSHVLYPALQTRYAPILRGQYDAFEAGLWVVVTSNVMSGKKKVVRSWARRRMVAAVMEGLRWRGFDWKGKKVHMEVGDGEGLAGPDVLVGTVDVEVLNGCVEKGFEEVRRQVGGLVDEIVRICGREVSKGKGNGIRMGGSKG